MAVDAPETVFCILKVHPKREAELLKLCRQHHETLKRLELCTEEPIQLYRGDDGHGGTFVVKIFEWRSSNALDAARRHPDVQRIWEAMDACCERMEFPHMEPVNG